MGRRQTKIKGPTVDFSTRHLRRRYRDKLRVYGDLLGLNMEEALDLALRYGLPELEKDAMDETEKQQAEG